MVKEKHAPPGGLEPPTFRLTAERANQLRHGGLLPLQICSGKYFNFCQIASEHWETSHASVAQSASAFGC